MCPLADAEAQLSLPPGKGVLLHALKARRSREGQGRQGNTRARIDEPPKASEIPR